MSKMSRKLHEQRLYEAAEETFIAEGGGRAPVARCASARVVVEPPNRHGGLSRIYRGYRYKVLSDALAYARLLSCRSVHADGRTVPAQREAIVEPTPT